MGYNWYTDKINLAIDFMLESIYYYLLYIFILYYLNYYLDVKYIYSQNNSIIIWFISYFNILSADILNNKKKNISETTRQLYNLVILNKDKKFWDWFSGIIDGNGYFDFKLINNKLILNNIQIKISNRDLRILKRIQNKLHLGKIIKIHNKSIWIISSENDIKYILNKLNGLIKIKYNNFEKACNIYNISIIKPNYIIESNNAYLSGLIDSKGSIIFNYKYNRIECILKYKYDYNHNYNQLNLDYVIPDYKPYKLINKNTYYITFKYQSVKGMINLYKYFMMNRLYSDMKFYRISKILKFIQIRENKDSNEYKLFIIKWLKYKNDLYYKIPLITKL